MKTVDLIDAVKGTGDIDKKFEYVVMALSTVSMAQSNAILSVLSALDNAQGIDKAALRKDLEGLKSELPISNDLIPGVYTQLIDLFLTRLN